MAPDALVSMLLCLTPVIGMPLQQTGLQPTLLRDAQFSQRFQWVPGHTRIGHLLPAQTPARLVGPSATIPIQQTDRPQPTAQFIDIRRVEEVACSLRVVVAEQTLGILT